MSRLEVETEEVLEALSSSLSADEVMSILELEDREVMESARPEGIEVLAALVEELAAWCDDAGALWSLLTGESLRAVLAGLGATVAKPVDERWTAAACYARLLAAEGAPVSVASPVLLRVVARAMDDKDDTLPNPKTVKRRRRRSSESSERDNTRTHLAHATKVQAFQLLVEAIGSANWARLQGELVRSEQANVVTRLASCLASKMAFCRGVDDALKSMVRAEHGAAALEALLDPLSSSSSSNAAAKLVDVAKCCQDEEALLGLRQRLCVSASGANAANRPRLVGSIAALESSNGGRWDDFLQRLAICSCPTRRALAVDVLLETCGVQAADTALARCDDKSALVRARALGALSQRVHLVSGEQRVRLGNLASRRASQTEPKSKVRTKALQVLEKLEPNAASIFAASVGASDDSPSVRLASVSALGKWLLADPESALLQKAWAMYALSAALDPSPAVVARVVDAVDGVFSTAASAAWRGCAAHIARSSHLRRCLRAAFVAAMANNNKGKPLGKLRALASAVLNDSESALGFGLAILEEALAAASRTRVPQHKCTAEWAHAAASIAEKKCDDATRASALRCVAALVIAFPGEETSLKALAHRLQAFRPLDDHEELGPESTAALVSARHALAHVDTTFEYWVRDRLDTAIQVVESSSSPTSALRLIAALSVCVDDDSLYRAANTVSMLATPSERCDREAANTFSTMNEAASPEETARTTAFAALAHLCATAKSDRLAKEHVPILAREIHVSVVPAIRATCLIALAEMCVEHASCVEPKLNSLFRALTNDPDAGVRRHAVVLVSRLISRDYVKWRVEVAHRFFAATADEDTLNAELARAALCGTLLIKQPTLIVNHFIAVLYVLNAARLVVGQPDNDLLRRAATNAIGLVDESTEAGRYSSAPRRFERDLADNFARNSDKRAKVYATLLAATPDEGKIQVAAKIAKDILASAADGLLGDLTDRDAPAANILADAFRLLSSDLKVTTSESAKQASSRTDEDDDLDDLDDDPNEPSAGHPKRQIRRVLAAAKGRLLSKMSKRHLLEQILPIIMNLKIVLRHTPLLADLMACLRDILKTYPADLDAVLAQDPHLQAELRYDLKRSADS